MTRAQFKELFDHHFDSVRNYIYYRSGDAEIATDIAQEAFIRVWEKQTRDDNPVGLLFKIARDQYISHYRKEKVITAFKLNARPERAAQSPEEQVVFEELKNSYEAALAKLPEKQRTVFLMSRMEQLKYHEISERVGVSVKAVEKRMSQALEALRKAIGND